jgi:adenosylmethionine-8-amino-7-oxononanoate aminotransferase
MPEWMAGEPLVIERAEGRYLFDTDGRRYFDAVSSLWVTVHGHSHPALVAAINTQLARLDHSTLLGLAHPASIELAERLLELAPPGLSRVFYSDSGSTAVEIALKQAYQYWALEGRPEKRRFLHLRDSYHGDTLGAVGVGGIPIFHRVFGPLVVAGIPLASPAPRAGESDPAALERSLTELHAALAAHHHEVAALVLEPLVQGAAGMLVHPRGYLAAAAEACRRHDVLLIADEVATGFGRTGTMFACEQESVSPDLLCLAKGITGGTLPLAATLCTDRIFQAFQRPRRELATFFHGHTYTGNPLACAAALANLEIFEREETLAHVRKLSGWMQSALDELAALPWVAGVRRCGVMAGIELGTPDGPFPADAFTSSAVCDAARAHGVIMRPLGDTLVWMPPLTTTDVELQHLRASTRAAILDVCPAAAAAAPV